MLRKSFLSGFCMLVSVFFIESSWAVILAPVLKWQRSGCYTSWCEKGWYSSPAVADLDNDGNMEVIGSAYSIVVLNGETGNLIWRVYSGSDRSSTTTSNVGRTWPGIVVADVDGDNELEIVSAHGDSYLSVYNSDGYFETGWPIILNVNEFRGLSVADLDQNNSMNIIVTSAHGNKTNTWVYDCNGILRSGWPQLNNDTGYAWGTYNDNAAIGDIDGDGIPEIIVPSDVHYICAYKPDGTQVQANAMYGDKAWGKVGVAVDFTAELRGYVHCGTEHRPNFAHCPATIADVNNDGTPEIVVTGNVHNCGTSPYTNLYHGVYIFNPDRSRFNENGFDWNIVPQNLGAPICQDYNIIESCMPNPVVADLDGDGFSEILFASNNGKIHCFWLDKTEKHNWPYSVYDSSEGFYRFASEPTVADLDNDGKAEVIFGSWTQKGSDRVGKLHIVDMYGNLLHEIEVPATSRDWNGILAAPTLANIDSDADLEVVVGTAYSGFCAYDLPQTENARILWGTGRSNYQRNGSTFNPTLVYCEGDFDKDQDVDGLDLSRLSSVPDLLPLATFVNEFGNGNCTQ